MSIFYMRSRVSVSLICLPRITRKSWHKSFHESTRNTCWQCVESYIVQLNEDWLSQINIKQKQRWKCLLKIISSTIILTSVFIPNLKWHQESLKKNSWCHLTYCKEYCCSLLQNFRIARVLKLLNISYLGNKIYFN